MLNNALSTAIIPNVSSRKKRAQKAAEKAINMLGGTSAVAERYGLTPMAVSKWKEHGISKDYCIQVQEDTDGAVLVQELREETFGSKNKYRLIRIK